MPRSKIFRGVQIRLTVGDDERRIEDDLNSKRAYNDNRRHTFLINKPQNFESSVNNFRFLRPEVTSVTENFQ